MTTVLVVDDSEVDRRLIGGLLEKDPEFTVTFAGDGLEALERLERVAPDLVVTDLQMPGMDGLELVAAVRAEYPQVPVILITAHGSEEIAGAALEWGAASYVPKPQLAQRLVDTARQVLMLSGTDREQMHLLEHLEETSFTLSLPNDSSLIQPLIDHVQLLLTSMGFCDATERVRIGVALEECLLNALYHGNLQLSPAELPARQWHSLADWTPTLADQRRLEDPYKDRKIHVAVHIDDRELRIVVRDEGPGFDVNRLPNPDDPANLVSTQRGLRLIHSFMDEVRYNGSGNEVTLIKFRVPREGS
ncbi:MAG: response regulator [Planctomycetia bacterium]|nr:response regulator [Planctomycetia bacterium]